MISRKREAQPGEVMREVALSRSQPPELENDDYSTMMLANYTKQLGCAIAGTHQRRRLSAF